MKSMIIRRRRWQHSRKKIIFRFCFIIGWFCIIFSVNALETIRWLGVHREREIRWNSTKICRRMKEQYDLTVQQVKICRKFKDVMPHVHQAANLTVQTCQALFKYHKWNCSSIENSPNLLPDLTQGTKEQALVYALTSAALTYTVARGCAATKIGLCGCSSHPDEPPNGNFKWGGCGDNVQWAYRFSRQFMEGTWKKDDKSASGGDSKSANKTAGRHHQQRISRDISAESSNDLMDAVNSHNSRIGGIIVKNSVTDYCKCHGVSGSCSIRTCWKGLPASFSDIANKLISSYEKALKFYPLDEPKSVSSIKNFSLAYLSESPDYCKGNPKIGSYGTFGRVCNATAASNHHASCNELCCGQSFKVSNVKITEWCHCKFVQCCRVICDTCTTVRNISTCS